MTLHKLVNGEVVPLTAEEIAEFAANEAQAPTVQWDEIRRQRNAKLAACDWTQLPDAPVDAAVWATYRQALRDVTTQNDPFNINWPTPPAFEGTAS